MSLARIRILLFTLILGAIALWITNQQPVTSNTLNHQTTKAPSYSWQATQTTVWHLNPAQSEKQSIIQAQRILYKDIEKKSEYLQPRVEIIDKKSISTLKSESGSSLEDKILSFNKDVEITQKTNPTTNETQNKSINTLKLTTDHIHYNLQTNQLTTDAKVTITQYNGQTIGTGLKANLKTSDLELLSNVKGTYYPQKMYPQKLHPNLQQKHPQVKEP